jgi:hypothetical protein
LGSKERNYGADLDMGAADLEAGRPTHIQQKAALLQLWRRSDNLWMQCAPALDHVA